MIKIKIASTQTGQAQGRNKAASREKGEFHSEKIFLVFTYFFFNEEIILVF